MIISAMLWHCALSLTNESGALYLVKISQYRYLVKRMWDTFYSHSAYIHIAFLTCQGLAQNLTFKQQVVLYGIGNFGALKSQIPGKCTAIEKYWLRISFWAHKLLSWVSVIIPGALLLLTPMTKELAIIFSRFNNGTLAFCSYNISKGKNIILSRWIFNLCSASCTMPVKQQWNSGLSGITYLTVSYEPCPEQASGHPWPYNYSKIDCTQVVTFVKTCFSMV